MRIRTITCHHVYNHGAYLQAYALVAYLKSLGHDAKIIDYRPPYLSGHYKLWTVPDFYKKRGLAIPYIMAKLPGRLKALSRKRVLDAFYDKYMDVDMPTYHSVEELRTNPPQADLYIAGSDQIWNTTFCNGRDAAFYLDFGDASTRRISYAASFATAEIVQEYKDFVKRKLTNFDAVSVREESGLSILTDFGISGIHVVDPVFLLDEATWRNFESSEGNGENYILVYDFYFDKTIKHISEALSKLYDCRIYSIGYAKCKYADKSFVNYGPTTFVSLVRHARCVVSNSFHGSAFSMIFKRDFFVVDREDGLNDRMHNLLSHYHIEDRLADDNVAEERLLSHIDYNEVDKILAADIEQSKSFINKQIAYA